MEFLDILVSNWTHNDFCHNMRDDIIAVERIHFDEFVLMIKFEDVVETMH